MAANYCNTKKVGFDVWVDGPQPLVDEDQVERRLCLRYFSNCCAVSRKVMIRKCDGFFIYQFPERLFRSISCYLTSMYKHGK
jgi:hypothetical protein